MRFSCLLVLLGATTATAQQSTVRYLALGDSFTCGTGSAPERSFPAQLARLGKRRGLDVRLENPARNGYSTSEVIDEELPVLEVFHPDVVTLAIGANDIVRDTGTQTYQANVRQIFAALLKAKVAPARIFVLPQPDWSASPVAKAFGSPATLRAAIEAHNAILKHEAEAVGASYVDLFALFTEQAARGLVADDGLHPSPQAYAAWAEALAPKLFSK